MMGNLTDDELMVLIGLVNFTLDGNNRPQYTNRTTITHHSNQGEWTANPIEIIHKLLGEAIERGCLKLPDCFRE